MVMEGESDKFYTEMYKMLINLEHYLLYPPFGCFCF